MAACPSQSFAQLAVAVAAFMLVAALSPGPPPELAGEGEAGARPVRLLVQFDRPVTRFRTAAEAEVSFLMRAFAYRPPARPEVEREEKEPQEETEAPPPGEEVEGYERELVPREERPPEEEGLPAEEGKEEVPPPPELPPFVSRTGPDASRWMEEKPIRGYAKLVVKNGRISGDLEGGKYSVVGDFEVIYQDNHITADQAQIDEDRETGRFEGNVRVTDGEFELTADFVEVNNRTKQMHAKGFVSFARIKPGEEPPGPELERRDRIKNLLQNEKSQLLCDELYYNWETEEMEASGEVRVVHPWMSATADRLTFTRAREAYELSGNVVLTLKEYDWIFRNDLVAPEEEKVTRVIARQPTTLTAERVVVSSRENRLEATGPPPRRAKVGQEDKFLEAEKITIDDDRKAITAEGSVHLYQKSGDWLVEGGQVDPRRQDPDVMERLKKEVHLTADSFTFRYEDKEMTATGRVVVVNGEILARSGKLIYDDRAKLLTLEGGVIMIRHLAERLLANRVEIDTERRRFTFFGLADAFFNYRGEVPAAGERETGEEGGLVEVGPETLGR